MKKSILLLLAFAAFAVVPRAYSDSISGSVAIAGVNDVSFTSTALNVTSGLTMGQGIGGSLQGITGSISLNGFDFATASGTELFTISNLGGSLVTFTIQGPISEQIVDGILTIAGSGIFMQPDYGPNHGNFLLSVSSMPGMSGMPGTTVLGLQAVAAPEPGSLLLLGSGLLALALLAFWKGKATASHTLGNA
jgi:hypothetical protein